MARVPQEVTIEHYGLKAGFFANQFIRRGYFDLFKQASATIEAIGSSLDWKNASELNVNGELVARLAIPEDRLAHYYCHPSVLISNPIVLNYYRCISTFSQKGLKTVSRVSNVERIEAGKPCSQDQAKALAQAINRNLNLIYGSIGTSDKHRESLMYATAGTTIDGGWRNAIGAEGERVVKTMLLKFLLVKKEIKAVVRRSGQVVDVSAIDEKWIEANTSDLQTAICTNSSQLRFGSEPDLKCVAADGGTTAGIEVKAGLDPAGALERLGAMLKSFEHVLAEETSAETILIASCITDEVQKRLNATRNVGRVFILTEVLNNTKGQGTRFCNMVRGCLGLANKRL